MLDNSDKSIQKNDCWHTFQNNCNNCRIILDDSLSVSYAALQQPSSKLLQKTLKIGTGRKGFSWKSEHQNPDSFCPVPLKQVRAEPGTRQPQSREELKENCKIMFLCPAVLLALTKCKVQSRILNKTQKFNLIHCWYIVMDRYRPWLWTVAQVLDWQYFFYISWSRSGFCFISKYMCNSFRWGNYAQYWAYKSTKICLEVTTCSARTAES